MSADNSAVVRPRRRWSARALPICAFALVALVAASLVGIDVARTLDHKHHSWLLNDIPVLDWLADHRWEQHITVAVGGVLALVGGWCVFAALLPGWRDLLPMRSAERITVGYLSRASVTDALRASALDVEHVVWVHAHLGRRCARVKVRIAAGDQEQHDAVRRRVHAALRRRFDSFGLAAPKELTFSTVKFRPEPPPIPGPSPATDQAQPSASHSDPKRSETPDEVSP
jgi:hypothetical protein